MANDETPHEDGLSGRVASLPLGVVIRRQPGVTRWQKWVWRAVAVLPGAGPADWLEIRRDGEAIEYHAGTVTLEVHRALTEGYRVALSSAPPVVYVILRDVPEAPGLEVHSVTASGYEAQVHLDSGDDIVEPVPMPPELIAWLAAFVERHHKEETFVKRKRRAWTEAPEKHDEGRGDPRVAEERDVFRAPTAGRRRKGRTVH